MRKILRSKPVMIAGAAAVARKVLKNRGSQKRRSKLPKKLGTFALLGAIGGAIRYFTNPVRGPERRAKLKGMGGKSDAEMAWQSASSPTSIATSDPSKSTGSSGEQPSRPEEKTTTSTSE